MKRSCDAMCSFASDATILRFQTPSAAESVTPDPAYEQTPAADWLSLAALSLLLIIPAYGFAADRPITAAPELDYRRQRVINQTLLREPEAILLFERFTEQVNRENFLVAAELFQTLTLLPEDTFHWEKNGQVKSLFQQALTLFELHPELWKYYRQLYEKQAEQQFDASSPESCRRIAQHYYPTRSGFLAISQLAAWAWDAGEFSEANRLWGLLVRSPLHKNSLTKGQLKQIWLASQMNQDHELQATLASLRSERTWELDTSPDGLRLTARDLHQWQVRTQFQSTPCWNLPRGTMGILSPRQQTPPMFHPAWIVKKDLFEPTDSPSITVSDQHIRTALEQWAARQQEQLTPELTSLFAVAAGDSLIYRDMDYIQAISLSPNQSSASPLPNKRRLWRYYSPSPLSEAIEYEIDPYTGVTTNHPGVDRLHLSNSITGSLTTDGQRVYLIDSIARLPNETVPVTAGINHSLDPSTPEEEQQTFTYRLANRLLALPVNPSEHHSGGAQNEIQPVWSIDSKGWITAASGHQPAQPHPLKGHFFLGPPVISRHRAFVLSEHDNFIQLSALEDQTGKLLWSQPISYVDRSIENDIMRATRACMPVCTAGLVICDNGNGQMVAIDSSLGTLVWSYCYADEDSRQDTGRWTYTQSMRITQSGALNLPLVAGNQVVMIPDRSNFIQCCDLQTGQFQWKINREDTEYLTLISNEKRSESSDTPPFPDQFILSVGARKCRAFNALNGEHLWESRVGFVSGHGVQVNGLYLLPVVESNLLYPDAQSLENSTRDLTFPSNTPALSHRSHHIQGRIVAIDLQTGQQKSHGFTSLPSDNSTQNNSPASTQIPQTFPLGNLLACSDMVVSVGIDKIVGFQQSGAVVAALEKRSQQQRLTEAELQQLAHAELVLGRIPSAKLHLQLALQLPRQSPALRNTSLTMYRELLYQELRDQPEHLLPPESLSILDELEELADSPEQQARYLLTKIELLLTYGDYERLWQATERFAQIGLHIPMSHRDEPGYLKTSSSWMPGIYSRLMKQMTPQEKQTLLKQIEANWLTKLDTLTTPQLYTFLDALSGRESDQEFLPLSASSCLTGTDSEFDHAATQICAIRDVITIELVGRAIKQKQLQKAELLLLDLRKSTTAQTQSLALQGLSNLYSQLGHYVQAGRCLQEMSCLPTDHSEQATNHELTRLLTYLTPGMQGVSETIKTVSNVPPPGNSSWLASEEYLALFDQDHPSWQAYRQQTQTEPPLSQVTIRTGQFDFEMSDPYARRRPLHTFQQQGLMLLQQVDLSRSINHSSSPDKTSTNHSTRSEEQHLLLLDRQTGTILNRIALPGTRIGISNSVSKQVGHLFPVTVEGHILGISLLEGRPIWERQGAFLEAIEASPDCQWKLHSDQIVRPVPDNRLASPQSRRIELGPVGSGYCIFQTARALVCLDPLTGSLLWKRTDLDPQGGLWSDRSSGLIGDDKVLVYFHADQNSYTLLDTQSGALLRRDQLEHTPVQVQRTRQVFGRNLMYMTVTTIAPQERRLRLWDPLSNSFDLDVKFESRDLYHASEEELTVFLSEGRLLIYQPQEKKTIADLTLAEEPLRRANYLRVLKHGNRFLVNLYQTQRVDGEQGYTSRYTDTPWNLTHINGPILSIDATDGSLEWTRTFPNRSIVEDLHADMPFLLMCANYQTRPGDQDRQLLLEAVDPQTGKTIQLRNNLSSARLLLLNHDHAQKIIRLTGLEEEILLDYGAEKISSRE